MSGDVHFFAGGVAEAKIFRYGLYLSFTGVITFAKNYEELVKFVPLDRILIETDCPYVAPIPFRERAMNLYMSKKWRKKELAIIKGVSLEEVATTTVSNWVRLFGSKLNP